MRVLITGGDGQLGTSLRKTIVAGTQAVFADKNKLNLESKDAISDFMSAQPLDFVINAAAYTQVDLAEKEREAAFAVNGTAVKNLAEVCTDKKIYLIHISTDFLFHGGFNRPIDEEQKINPIGVYAESKAAGEKAFVESGVNGAIVRTAWLYSEFGANFMKTMIRLGKEKPKLTVIADQHGSPTYAVDLARGLWSMIESLKDKPASHAAELFHFSNSGVTTWYDFATAILEFAGLVTPVEPILTAEYPVPTPRPAYSALWSRKFSTAFNFPIRHWRAALADAVTAFQGAQK
jgi:dTDP-4-dehydrorhamnose reductase